MKKFKKMTEAHSFFIGAIQEIVNCPKLEGEFSEVACENCSSSENCNVQEISDKLQEFSYAKFTLFLKREYPGATKWMSNSLESIVKPWGIIGWPGYSDYTGIPKRTCQKYTIKNEDYELIRGNLVAVPSSADQFKKEMEFGLRGNRPKNWTHQS